MSLATEADVTVVVYDLLGRTVLAETLGTMSVGVHELDVDASALPPGHYVYRLSAGPDRATSPFVVIN